MKTLIIEDEPTSARLLTSALKTYGPVAHAPAAPEAFELYRKALELNEPFDLICLDLELPKYDGLEFLDEIRRAEDERGVALHTGVKILITTGHADPQTFFDANSGGCDGFLTKPVNRDKLVSELKRLGLA